MSAPPPGFERRHVVAVEDHLYHTTEWLESIARTAPQLMAWTTVCAIDEAGPDTTTAVGRWLDEYAGLQVVARVDPAGLGADLARRLLPITGVDVAELSGFAKLVALLLRPNGVLVQDIHLSTLRFIPPDRWWESIFVAATVRGMFAQRQPAIRFVSNKRGYTATFGRELMDAGFDPRDVMDKAELDSVIVPAIARDVEARFPFELASSERSSAIPIGADDLSKRETDASLDVVEWDIGGRIELGGRLLEGPVAFRAGSNEALTWHQLIADRLAGGRGVPVADVGQRLAPEGAERAEISNIAARHIHVLRGRLSNPVAIVTAHHAYTLHDSVTVGRVRRRVQADLP
jgi:hypothetical protein